jgi:hypothetical protein
VTNGPSLCFWSLTSPTFGTAFAFRTYPLASPSQREREKERGRTPGTYISVMFSGSALLGSNLGNAMMPGEGSLHQIREALHLQDVGQARAALQKHTSSQQKPQSRAMAGPCHLIQDDIPSLQCSPSACSRAAPPAFPGTAGRPSLRSLPTGLLGASRRCAGSCVSNAEPVRG